MAYCLGDSAFGEVENGGKSKHNNDAYDDKNGNLPPLRKPISTTTSITPFYVHGSERKERKWVYKGFYNLEGKRVVYRTIELSFSPLT